jgi:hypothetical protein
VLIRILGEGQFVVPDSELDEINRLDRELEASLKSVDGHFQASLDALLDKVRSVGVRPPHDEFAESVVILPFADASEDDIRDMLGDEGLVPDH